MLFLVTACALATNSSVAYSSVTNNSPTKTASNVHWFESFKTSATTEEMYAFLQALPKGGDIHNHMSGSGLPEWWFELATDSSINSGYQYYTKTQVKHCQPYGGNEFGGTPYLMMFHTIQRSTYEQLSQCSKSEYQPLTRLSEEEKNGWLNSIRLDKPYEGREEFFQRHWQRLGDLTGNPFIMSELLVKNMQAFGEEGVMYLETQMGPKGYMDPGGNPIQPNIVADIFRHRLQEKDAKSSGVTARLQYAILRFAKSANEDLKDAYQFVDKNRDIYVGVNLVGREDNDKGHPLRFLNTLRELRKTTPTIPLSLHAGEVDEPNQHIRESLLLGAKRIGHGVNLLGDPDTLLLMQSGRYLIEINLVSNLLLEYINDYSEHPFPEYLRTGIPVALTTDDRGMWDSNMTDEYFTAVTEFNLSWEELITLGENSLQHSFLDHKTKTLLLKNYREKVKRFEKKMKKKLEKKPLFEPKYSKYSCRQWQLCTKN
ncbi:adenosine deaminase [Marinibactrum halimedae]|uniref:Adenosine deaminase n=2 Tax=Marinibactrum halimedae TaxID=1444977 RepID=A0AA37T7F8_9GAMM|nr:adenosine deaminase [Marinibactrum halimedae]